MESETLASSVLFRRAPGNKANVEKTLGNHGQMDSGYPV